MVVNVRIIYTIKTRRLSVVSVTVAAALAGDTDGLSSWLVTVGVVDSQEQTLSGRGARVYTGAGWAW